MVYLKIAAEALAHVGMCIQPVWSLDPDLCPLTLPLTVRVTVGHRAGSARRTGQALPRFYPLGWSRAITCRGICKEIADAQSGFSGPAKAILSLRTGRLGRSR